MSVWASRIVIDADDVHDVGPGPLLYLGSHVIPSADGERGGSVDTAHLPGFLSRDGYDDTSDGEDMPWWPFLRLAVRPAQRPSRAAWRRLRKLADELERDEPELAADIRSAADAEDTVILDVTQVDALIADLVDWRANVDEEKT